MLPSDPIFKPEVKTLETNRLSIRIDTEQDYVRMFRTCDDDTLKQYFGITTEAELEKQKGKVRGGLTTYRTSVMFFHLIERSMNKVVGQLAFHNWFPMHRRSEIGYSIVSDEYKNKGYMREAIAPIIDFGFEAMELNRIEAFIDPGNMPSRKLVTRIGFQPEGLLCERYCYDGVVSDALVYRLLRQEYAGAAKQE
jgi:ribosomal-protein-alanine N-acetyltransferase